MVAVRLGPDEHRLLRLSVHALTRAMGDLEEPPRFPKFPDLTPYFGAFVLAAMRPHVRAYHRERGIPARLSRLILTDLGRNMAVHRRRFGVPGVNAPEWVQRHF